MTALYACARCDLFRYPRPGRPYHGRRRGRTLLPTAPRGSPNGCLARARRKAAEPAAQRVSLAGENESLIPR